MLLKSRNNRISSKNTDYQECTEITTTETKATISKTGNWKAPGVDGIANFWIKNLTSIHEDLAQAYNDIVKNPEKCPKWLTQGITYLLPKTAQTNDPKN